MRKFVALVTLSTVAALGAVAATAAGTASALESNSGIEQSLVEETGCSRSAEDMMEMAMLMNQLTQLSEVASSVMSPANAAIFDMSRSIKS